MFKFELIENEQVLKIYRQTETVLFKTVLIVFGLIYFPWYFLIKYDLAADYTRWLLLWTLLILLYAGHKYLIWLLNVYLVTDRRVIKVTYYNIFNKEVFETPLLQILNVSFSIKGFWQSLFRFGSVEIRASGLHQPLVLKHIAHPSKVKDFIWHVRGLKANQSHF